MITHRASFVFACASFCWFGSTAPFAAAQQPLTPATTEQPEKPKPIYDESAKAEDQIAQALAKAKKENRRVLVQWGANWCGWCHLLHDTFESNPAVRKELLYEYDLVLVDIGKWDKNMELAASYGADLKGKGVPYLTILDADGKVLANQETGVLENGKAHDPAKVLDVLKQHEATPLDAETVLSDALAKARDEHKAVFVHFGAPWCGWCHRLEDWLARPEIGKLVGKDFVEVKIDTDRMNGGAAMLTRYRESDQGGIPWFAFLTPDGKKIITSDGPQGNVGCPYKDEEIDYFGEMIRKAKTNLKDDEINTLLESLRKGRDQK